MKQVALKNLINDLHMSGVFDTCSNSFMNVKDIEKNVIINELFKEQPKSIELTQAEQEDLPTKEEVSREIDFLFSTFNSPTEVSENLEVFSKKEDENKFKKRRKAPVNATTEVKPKEIKEEIKFSPEEFITIKTSRNSKIALVVLYKSEDSLKRAKDEFDLLKNILKTMEYDFSNISCIFVNPAYKNITKNNAKSKNILATYLLKQLECVSENIIFLFGKDILKIMDDKNFDTKIKSVDKNILENYSLSAMLNNRKYKSQTWENILSIKDQLNK